MTKIKKASAVIALTAASTLAILGGKSLFEDVQFAHAEAQVQATSSQLQSVRDLSTVFRDVGKVVEPSVVQIVVHKTVKGGTSSSGGGGGNIPPDQLRKFFKEHGLNVPLPDDGNGNGDENGNGDDNAPDQGLEEVGTGSGVIMETNGSDAYILTNNHVAGDATEMTVTLADGREIHGGKTIGADAKADLAVVKIHAEHLIPAKWGDSDQLDRGDWVLAFGSPFGYVGSMTHGIVSALHRQANIIANGQGYENFIQVDAPINPGNSGGPLVNIHGEVVGINTAIATKSGSFSGIGFAIPSEQAKVIYGMLKDKGHVTRGWLGVSIEDVHRDPGLAKSFGYDDDKGVIVQQVMTGTPASGKLQAGDIITSIEGKSVGTVQELRNQVAVIAPGTNVKLGVFRDNKETEVELALGEQPENVMALGPNSREVAPKGEGSEETAVALGMHLSSVTDELADKFSLGDSRTGALITAVSPKSLAAKAGLFTGDLITRVGGKPVTSAAEASKALAKADVKKGIRLYITNAQGSRFVFLQDNSDQ